MTHPRKPTPMGRKLMGLLRQTVADDSGEGLPAISHRLPLEAPGWIAPRTFTVYLSPDENGAFLVTCREVPSVLTFGENEEDALSAAEEAIREALGAPRSSSDVPH